jgi:hypothetical protein
MDMGGLCLRGTKEVTVRAQDPGRSLMQTGNIRRLRTTVNEAAASWAHPGLRVVRVLASKFRVPIRLNCQGMPDGRARTGQTVFLLYFARRTVAEDRFRTRREAPVKVCVQGPSRGAPRL